MTTPQKRQPKAGPGRPPGQPESPRSQQARKAVGARRHFTKVATGRAAGPTLPISAETESAVIKQISAVAALKLERAKLKALKEEIRSQVASGELVLREEVEGYLVSIFGVIRRELDRAPQLLAAYPDITTTSASYVTQVIMNVTSDLRNRLAKMRAFQLPQVQP